MLWRCVECDLVYFKPTTDRVGRCDKCEGKLESIEIYVRIGGPDTDMDDESCPYHSHSAEVTLES